MRTLALRTTRKDIAPESSATFSDAKSLGYVLQEAPE